MLSAFHHADHRRQARQHVTLEHWLLTAGSLLLTALTIMILFLVIFATRAT
jgi:hypothetical protein